MFAKREVVEPLNENFPGVRCLNCRVYIPVEEVDLHSNECAQLVARNGVHDMFKTTGGRKREIGAQYALLGQQQYRGYAGSQFETAIASDAGFVAQESGK